MPRIKTVVGVAGAAKTTYGIELVKQKLRDGLRWDQVGYSSFSRAACAEAARRAADICGEDAERLQRHGSFATLHSLALRAIGVDRKAILDPESADGRKFIQSSCGAAPDPLERGTLGEHVSSALSQWDLYRARLGSNLTKLPDPRSLLLSSGILPDDSGWVTSVITSVITRKSCDEFEFGSEKRRMMTHESGRNFRVASSTFPMFYLAKALFLNQLSCIGGRENEIDARDAKIFDEPKPIPCGAKQEIPYRIKEKVMTHGVSSVCHQRPILGFGTQLSAELSWTSVDDIPVCHQRSEIAFDTVKAYEREKNLYGRIDFTDILLMFLGVSVNENLELVRTYDSVATPNSVQAWIVDEYQDCSPLLACVAERLSEAAQELYLLGDPYQAVYGFAGSSGLLLRSYDVVANQSGDSVLLNTSYRNPIEVVEWGEEALREDESYEERQPGSEAWEDGEVGVYREGSVGLVEWSEFLSYLPEMAQSDTMVLSRTWLGLIPVKERLDSMGVPWRSCQEKQASRWECPAKIAYTLAMRALAEGEQISEQDWRRITDTLPQKMDRVELFTRGTKAKWAKLHCSQDPHMTLQRIEEWGATADFVSFVQSGKWRREMFALLDNAITQFGIDVVRNPRIRLGSVHSVKGLEARNVFCLSASTERCSGEEANKYEEICLKYVAITRASKNYRLVVNPNDIARSKPQFWAAPRGFWEFSEGPPQGHYSEPKEAERIEDPVEDFEVDDWPF